MDVLSAVSTYFKTGGPFMFIILAAGVMILAIAVERLWVIGRAAALDSSKFAGDLETLVGRGDHHGALELAGKVKTPVGKAARNILAFGTGGQASPEAAAEDAAVLVLPPLTRRLSHLATLANVATLLGLLGTIFGLTTAFSAVGAADPSQRSAFLAAGISQALNTTSFGLIIAVPALLCHGYLTAKVERIVEGVDEVAIRLVRVLKVGASAPAPMPVGTPEVPMAALGAVRR